MMKQLYGETKPHPDVAGSLNNLANALAEQGDRKCLDEAIDLHRQSIKMRKQLYGETAAPRRLRRSATWPMR